MVQLTCRECNCGCENRGYTRIGSPDPKRGTGGGRDRGLSGVSLAWGCALSLQVSILRCVSLGLGVGPPLQVSPLNSASLMLTVGVPLRVPTLASVFWRKGLGKGPCSRPTYFRRGRTRQWAKQTMVVVETEVELCVDKPALTTRRRYNRCAGEGQLPRHRVWAGVR